MTCRKCLHAPVCFDSEGCTKYYGLEIAANNVEELCLHFVDRSRYVVREKGEWRNNKDDYPECDKCGYMPQYDPMIDDIYYSDFCPNCGADMRKGGERMKRLDIIDVKQNIKEGYVRLAFPNGNIILVDNTSGEAVKIGELPMKGSDNE